MPIVRYELLWRFRVVCAISGGRDALEDSYDQHAVLNRGFVQDITKLPARSGSMAAKTSNDPVIPPAALGADLDERASEPLPQNPPARNRTRI